MEKEVISRVMIVNGVTTAEIPQEHGVNPANIDSIGQSKRYFKTKAFASFGAHSRPGSGAICSRNWKSAHAWCVLDLKKQCIAHKLSQDCKSCNGRSRPDLDAESMERMAEYAVDLYLKRVGRRPWQSRDPFDLDDLYFALDDRPPHDESRCEMCRNLGKSCWKK